MDPVDDKELMWIARKGIVAPVPKPWKKLKNKKGNVYYYNTDTGKASWEHPNDVYYKQLYYEERARKFKECY